MGLGCNVIQHKYVCYVSSSRIICIIISIRILATQHAVPSVLGYEMVAPKLRPEKAQRFQAMASSASEQQVKPLLLLRVHVYLMAICRHGHKETHTAPYQAGKHCTIQKWNALCRPPPAEALCCNSWMKARIHTPTPPR